MNRSEITKLLAVIQGRYPRMETGDASELVTAWYLTLDDVPYQAAEFAVRRWFKEQRFPPDPSELRQMILEEMHEVPEAAKAWQEVITHIRQNGTIGGKPFAGPQIISETVAAIGGWYNLRTSTEPTRDREAFIRAYTTYSRRSLSDLNIQELIDSRLVPLQAETDSEGDN